MLEIRNASTEDIPLIRELNFQIWPQTYSSILTKDQIDYMLEMMYSAESLYKQMTDDHCTFILLYSEGNPVGFASYSEEKSQIWKLHKIYVLPVLQGKGIGKIMIQHIIQSVKNLNGSKLQLQVNRNNKAKDFYEKLGFKVLYSDDFDIGGGYYMNDYVMELDLITSAQN